MTKRKVAWNKETDGKVNIQLNYAWLQLVPIQKRRIRGGILLPSTCCQFLVGLWAALNVKATLTIMIIKTIDYLLTSVG